ncbi:hypothetical protein I7I53_11886 [Histoplasma capsulatum var. duboisii H88]|uniref:Uncharacterized protein n=1 Tax=Ajellomyces capsulatus (strain H88) TaxID=544711 RepID=A0A8A1M0D2_AJEC8|nr:hypothetical protein I7I53_11886 [Histoplasma capsulatum var. duboisii H88]
MGRSGYSKRSLAACIRTLECDIGNPGESSGCRSSRRPSLCLMLKLQAPRCLGTSTLGHIWDFEHSPCDRMLYHLQ